MTAYLEGTLPQTDRVRLEAHLEQCAYCVKYIEQMRTTAGALHGFDDEAPSPETKGLASRRSGAGETACNTPPPLVQ